MDSVQYDGPCRDRGFFSLFLLYYFFTHSFLYLPTRDDDVLIVLPSTQDMPQVTPARSRLMVPRRITRMGRAFLSASSCTLGRSCLHRAFISVLRLSHTLRWHAKWARLLFSSLPPQSYNWVGCTKIQGEKQKVLLDGEPESYTSTQLLPDG